MKRISAVVGLGMLLAWPLAAGAQSLGGTYNLTVVLPGFCTWRGQLSLTQIGMTLSGTGSVALQPGSDPMCVPLLSGTVSGSISGSTINFGVATGAVGAVNFSGTASPNFQTLSGTWVVPGIFSGTWLATRAAAPAPAMHGVAFAALIVLLPMLGYRQIRRSRRLHIQSAA